MGDYWRILATNVAKGIKARDWDQSRLAKEAGTTTGSISNIMTGTGTKNPSLDVIVKIAKAFKIAPANLLAEETELAGDHPLEECHRRVGEAISYRNREESVLDAAREIFLTVARDGLSKSQQIEIEKRLGSLFESTNLASGRKK